MWSHLLIKCTTIEKSLWIKIWGWSQRWKELRLRCHPVMHTVPFPSRHLLDINWSSPLFLLSHTPPPSQLFFSSIFLLIPSPGGRVDQIRGIFQGHPGPYCPVKFQSWVRPKASALSISHSSQPGSNSCLITGAEHSKPKGEQKTKAEIGREGGGRQPQKLSSY